MGSGQLDKAIESYSKAIAISNQYPQAFINRGNAYLSKKMFDEAINDLDTAIQLDAANPQSYNILGIVYKAQGEYNKAIQNYSMAIALKPDFVFAYNNRAIAFYFKDMYIKALNDYQTAINLDPQNPYYYFIHLIISSKISDNEFNKSIKRIKEIKDAFIKKEWEYKIFQYLAGESRRWKLIRATKGNNEKKCEAFCYVGFSLLHKKRKFIARLFFKRCIRTNITSFIEYELAIKELNLK
jgi:lipoprotein NlpI